jgi:hypothetical protein
MSREDGVQLASRALALLMIVWALVEFTYLPGTLLSMVHQLSPRSVLAPRDYWVASSVANTMTRVLRLIGLSVAAVWFWNCDPGVQSVFSVSRQSDPPV